MQSMSATSIPGRLALPAAVVILALACTALAACGGSSHGASPDVSAPPAAAVATRPPASTPPAKLPTPRAVTHNTAKAPTGARPPAAAEPRVREVFAQFTSCMRKNGVEVPQLGAKPGLSRKPLAPAGPRFEAALAKCRSTLTAALGAAPAGAHAGAGKG